MLKDWETGISVGRALERLSSHERRMDRIEADHEHLQTEVSEAKTIAVRVGLVVILWLGGMVVKIPSEQGSEFVAGVLKAFLSK
jgi:hypothetical protein